MAREDVIVQLRLLGARAVASGARGAGNAIGRMGQQAATAEVKGLRRLQATSGGVASGLNAMTRVATRAAVAVGAVSGVAAAFATREGVGFLTTVDRQRVAFETFTGSATKAAWIMREVQKLAEESPALGVASAGSGVSALMSFGMGAKDALAYTRRLSDGAAASGANIEQAMERGSLALGQIQAKGKLATQELNQLSEGVRLNRGLVAKELGMTGAEMSKALEQGKISAKEAIPAIGRAMDKQFKGAQQRFTKTTEGRLLALRDVFASRMGQVLRPAYDAAGRVFQSITDRLKKVDTDALGKRLAGVMESVGVVIRRVPWGEIRAAIAGAAAGASDLLGRIDWGQVAEGATRFALAARDAGRQLIDALKPAVPFLQNVLWPVLRGVAKGVAGTLIVAFKILVPVVRVVASALGWLGEKARPLAPWFERLGLVLGMLFPGAFLRVLGTVAGGFIRAGGAAGRMGGIFAGVIRVVSAPLRIVIGIIQRVIGLVRRLGPVFRQAAGLMSKAWGTATGRLAKWLDNIATWFERMWRRVEPVVSRITGAAEKLTGIVGAVVSPGGEASAAPAGAVPWVKRAPAATAPVTTPSAKVKRMQEVGGPRRGVVVENHNTLTLDRRVLHKSTTTTERELVEHR